MLVLMTGLPLLHAGRRRLRCNPRAETLPYLFNPVCLKLWNPSPLRRLAFRSGLRINERTKPKMYGQVFESARISSLNYWLEIVFSAALATFGLVLNSSALFIGAILISPLMGPIMATGLALATGDLYLAIKAVVNVVMSVAAAIGLAAFYRLVAPFSLGYRGDRRPL